MPPWLGRRMLDLGELDAARIVLSPFIPPRHARGTPTRNGQVATGCRRPARAVQGDRRPARSPGRSRRSRRKGLGAARLPGARAGRCRSMRSGVTSSTFVASTSPIRSRRGDARIDEIWQAASRLDELGLDALRFAGPGTDLTVGLLPSSRFARDGGTPRPHAQASTTCRISPTEELFTTPDPERTEGFVRLDKAARRRRFRRDRPPDSLRRWPRRRDRGGRERGHAPAAGRDRRGRGAPRRGGARRRQEQDWPPRPRRSSTRCSTKTPRVTSPSATRYATPIADPADLPRINESEIHVDFMIGSEEVAVSGVTHGGDEVPLLVGGAWQV